MLLLYGIREPECARALNNNITFLPEYWLSLWYSNYPFDEFDIDDSPLFMGNSAEDANGTVFRFNYMDQTSVDAAKEYYRAGFDEATGESTNIPLLYSWDECQLGDEVLYNWTSVQPIIGTNLTPTPAVSPSIVYINAPTQGTADSIYATPGAEAPYNYCYSPALPKTAQISWLPYHYGFDVAGSSRGYPNNFHMQYAVPELNPEYWELGIPISFQFGLTNFITSGSPMGQLGKIVIFLSSGGWRYFQGSGGWTNFYPRMRAKPGVNYDGTKFTIDHSDMPNLPDQWNGDDIMNAIGLPFFHVEDMEIPLDASGSENNLGLDMSYYPGYSFESALNLYKYTNWRMKFRIDIYDRNMSPGTGGYVHRAYVDFRIGSTSFGLTDGFE